MDGTSFHTDELAAQAHAGVRTSDVHIRALMPEQHRRFFGSLSYLFVAAADAQGWPLATLLEGDPGFVSSPDPTTLHVHALPDPAEPAAGTLRVGQEIGLLGIDLATRRRNRANGVLCALDEGFTIAVRQSFGNCPKYIQRRAISRVQAGRAPAESLVLPDERARELIERADTFFVASRSRAGVGPAGGADISHRGGRPGFVRMEQDTLWIPDYRGNRFFNTLGNLLGEPRSSLLFLDFQTGGLLQLQGLATIDWSDSQASALQGAERLWRFRIVRGWYRPHASTLRGRLIDYSPSTLGTGTWAHT